MINTSDENVKPGFCNKCGKEINDDDIFCKYCGNELQNKDTEGKIIEATQTEIIEDHFTNRCPICRKSDSIARLSAVVSAGSSDGSYVGPTSSISVTNGKWGVSHGFASLSGYSINQLARKLSQPPNPSTIKKTGKGCLYIIFGYLVIVALGMFMAIYLFVDSGDTINSSGVGVFSCWSMLFIAIGIVPYLYIKNERDKEEKEFFEYKPKWQKAMLVWENLYYCARDDIVFNPDSGEYTNSNNLNSMIFQ